MALDDLDGIANVSYSVQEQTSSPPAEDDLFAWYDFSEEDGTTPVTDLSGNGNDLGSGSYTGVSTDINGVQAGRFQDGDQVYTTNLSSTVTAPQTIAFVSEYVADSSGDDFNVVVNISGSDTGYVSYNTSNDNVDGRDGPGGAVTGGSQSDQLIVNKREQNDAILRTQGDKVDTGSQYTDLVDISLAKSLNNTSRRMDGKIGEVLIYPQDKSGIFGDIESYLADKWNITL
jgi:hypothetical protein